MPPCRIAATSRPGPLPSPPTTTATGSVSSSTSKSPLGVGVETQRPHPQPAEALQAIRYRGDRGQGSHSRHRPPLSSPPVRVAPPAAAESPARRSPLPAPNERRHRGCGDPRCGREPAERRATRGLPGRRASGRDGRSHPDHSLRCLGPRLGPDVVDQIDGHSGDELGRPTRQPAPDWRGRSPR